MIIINKIKNIEVSKFFVFTIKTEDNTYLLSKFEYSKLVKNIDDVLLKESLDLIVTSVLSGDNNVAKSLSSGIQQLLIDIGHVHINNGEIIKISI